MRVNISEIRFGERTRLILLDGREVRPLEDPILLDAGWFVPCGLGFEDGDGKEEEFIFALADVAAIRNCMTADEKILRDTGDSVVDVEADIRADLKRGRSR